jgi:uncharacterized membrane protein YoaK (UPF0700 family)
MTASQAPAIAMSPPAPVVFKDRSTAEYVVTTIGGMLLAFNAGYMNGTTMDGSNRISTTHVSGTATRLGRYLATGDGYEIALNGGIILCFILGSFISGCFIPNQSFYFGSAYGKLFVFGSIVLILASVANILAPEEYWYDYLCAIAAGMQNGMVSRYSGNILRTTHHTGTCTDIGLFTGRRLVGNSDYIWKLRVLIALLLSFFFGSYVAGLTYPTFKKFQLLANVVFYFSVGLLYSIYLKYSKTIGEMPLIVSLFGSEEKIVDMVNRKSMENLTPVTDVDGLLGDKSERESFAANAEIPNIQFPILAQSNSGPKQILLVDKHPPDQPKVTSIIATTSHNSHSSGVPINERNRWDFLLVLACVCLLTLNMGFVNGTTQSGPNGTSTTHMTSTVTNFGLNLAHRRWEEARINIATIGSFISGSCLSGLVVPNDVFSLVPLRHGPLLILISVVLTIAAVLALKDDSNYAVDHLCSFAAGIQNGMASKYSSSVIRTSHVSGACTDIGSALAAVVFRRQYKDMWKLQLLVPSVTCFIMGGFLAKEFYPILGSAQLFINVGFTIAVGLFLFVYQFYLHAKSAKSPLSDV